MGKKNEILDISLNMFNSSNIKSVTTNHICKELGISPGNLYYHFKNKEEIIRSLFKNFCDKHNFLKDKYLNIADIKIMSKFYDEFFEMVWEFRFILRESYYLRSISPELNDLFIKHNISLISGIYNQSHSYRSKGLIEDIDKDILLQKAEIVTILLNNLINHDNNHDNKQWNKNCERYKTLITHVFSS